MPRLLSAAILWCLIAVTPAVGQADRAGAAVFEYGARPALPVFDHTGTLPVATVERLARTLDAIREQEQIDIIVVQLADTKGAPPEHIARSFANAWCRPLFHCVVLHVPGNPESPWILPGGTLMRHFNPTAVEHQTKEARHRASLETTSVRQLEAATEEAADMLRVWVGEGTYWAGLAGDQAMQASLKAWNRQRLGKLLLPLGGTLLVLAVVLTYLIIRWLDSWRSRMFPELDWERRLGAPYAGGNDSTRIIPSQP